MLYYFKVASLSLQLKYKAFQIIGTQRICVCPLLLKNSTFKVHFTVLDKDMVWSIFSNLAQFFVTINRTTDGKCSLSLHLEHYTPKNKTLENFQKNKISVWQGSVAVVPKANGSKLNRVNSAHLKTLYIYYSRHETLPVSSVINGT